jgi:hypothetical protein
LHECAGLKNAQLFFARRTPKLTRYATLIDEQTETAGEFPAHNPNRSLFACDRDRLCAGDRDRSYCRPLYLQWRLSCQQPLNCRRPCLSIWQWIKPDVVILCIPAQSMENHRHPTKQHSPAFAGKECNRLLSSHFMNQPAVVRRTREGQWHLCSCNQGGPHDAGHGISSQRSG